mmetsp:Transcript_117925/g.328540  ORF Transcript_117925/g.328540 Transcript_117925/m.328540 type:complete len:329 (+) Transcript_117925:45-1031(+)
MWNPTASPEQQSGASVTPADAGGAAASTQQNEHLAHSAVSGQQLDPASEAGALQRGGWEHSSGPYDAVLGNHRYGAWTRPHPYAPVTGQPLQPGAPLSAQPLTAAAPDDGTQLWAIVGGDWQGVGAKGDAAEPDPPGTSGQQFSMPASPEEPSAPAGGAPGLGASAGLSSYTTLSGLGPQSTPQGGMAQEANTGLTADAAQYSTALAQYYAALAAAPQYLPTGTQPLDPLQQAALAQYQLYAAYAAQASGMGLGTLGAAAGGPSTAWITNRLIDREKARLDRNFDEADKIRAELRQRGVEVDDRLRTWSSRDGRRGHRPNHNDIPEAE